MNGHSEATLQEYPEPEKGPVAEPAPASPRIGSSLKSSLDQHEYSDPVDGGVRAWLTVLGGFIALFCSFGQLNAFGTFQAWYATHQLSHLHPSTISWIGSLQLWVFFFSGTFVGHAFDKHGPRPVLIVGSIILVFSIMMTSLSTQYYQYMLGQGILLGLGVGMMFYVSLASIATHFTKYRATAIGVASAGSGVGGTVFPIILPRLFHSLGFAWTVRVIGFITLACCALSLLLITRRAPNPRPFRTSNSWIDYPALRDIRFVLLAVGSALVCFGLFIPYFYISSYAESFSDDLGPAVNRASPPHASISTPLAVLNAASVLGRTIPPLIADILGPYNTLFPCAFLSGLFCFVLWLPAQQGAGFQPLVIAFTVLYGFSSGGVIAVVPPCVARISDATLIGTRMGMLYTVISIPSLLGGPVAGALLAHDHSSYADMIVVAGSAMVAGSLFILGSRFTVNRQLWEKV